MPLGSYGNTASALNTSSGSSSTPKIAAQSIKTPNYQAPDQIKLTAQNNAQLMGALGAAKQYQQNIVNRSGGIMDAEAVRQTLGGQGMEAQAVADALRRGADPSAAAQRVRMASARTGALARASQVPALLQLEGNAIGMQGNIAGNIASDLNAQKQTSLGAAGLVQQGKQFGADLAFRTNAANASNALQAAGMNASNTLASRGMDLNYLQAAKAANIYGSSSPQSVPTGSYGSVQPVQQPQQSLYSAPGFATGYASSSYGGWR